VPQAPSDIAEPYRIVGTAGHIDHGKSALVEALTGTHPDRLAEEIERGITIDLGFANTEVGGFQIAFVDVPGHERFVKNMLAGVGGIDAVILVVAADESVMPQTREHLAICELLGVKAGLVALTKCDLVDDEMAELAELEVTELLEGTTLSSAPIVRTSATTGAGLDALREQLTALLRQLPPRHSRICTRLPIDRVFTIRGFGTVVTGTLLSGNLRVGDKLVVLPDAVAVTVRGLQVHGEATETARAGQRVAINLHGVHTADLSRGDVLARPGALQPSHVLDVRIDVLPGFTLKHLQRVRFHHGAAELLGRVALLDANEVPGPDVAYGQLRLESAYAAVPGDRVVLRRYSPLVTIAGAIVLDVHPGKRRRSRAAAQLLREMEAVSDVDRLRQWVVEAGDTGIGEVALARRSGRARAPFQSDLKTLRGDPAVRAVEGTTVQWVARPVFDTAATAALATVTAYHVTHPLRPGIEHGGLRAALGRFPDQVVDAVVADLVTQGRVLNVGRSIALTTHQVALTGDLAEIYGALLTVFADGGLAPPTPNDVLKTLQPAEIVGEVFRLALRRGDLTRITDQYVVATAAFEGLVTELRERLAPGAHFTISEFKEWTALSRRHSIPMLEHLDTARVTRRSGDDRVLA